MSDDSQATIEQPLERLRIVRDTLEDAEPIYDELDSIIGALEAIATHGVTKATNEYKEASDFVRNMGAEYLELFAVNAEFRNAIYRAINLQKEKPNVYV